MFFSVHAAKLSHTMQVVGENVSSADAPNLQTKSRSLKIYQCNKFCP